VGGRQGALCRLAGQQPVADQIVEEIHHLRLGHDRQARQVGELEACRVDAMKPPGVKGGTLHRRCQEEA
jgi:hypothetical protein